MEHPDAISHPPNDKNLAQGTGLISSIISGIDLEAASGLVSFWLGRGTNLVLGGWLTETCVRSLTDVLSTLADNDTASHASLAQRLFENSTRRLTFPVEATLEDFVDDVGRTNIRWETLVIALVALGRATIDVPYYPPLYSLKPQREMVQKFITEACDSCLELAISLGSMDDLLLVCQYENWILHSVIDGDQSESSATSIPREDY